VNRTIQMRLISAGLHRLIILLACPGSYSFGRATVVDHHHLLGRIIVIWSTTSYDRNAFRTSRSSAAPWTTTYGPFKSISSPKWSLSYAAFAPEYLYTKSRVVIFHLPAHFILLSNYILLFADYFQIRFIFLLIVSQRHWSHLQIQIPWKCFFLDTYISSLLYCIIFTSFRSIQSKAKIVYCFFSSFQFTHQVENVDKL